MQLKTGAQWPKTCTPHGSHTMPFRDPTSARPARSLPPLPGTDVPRRGLFISRAGALFRRAASGARTRAELPRFHPELLERAALDRLFRIQSQQWRIYLVGNEGSVAQGRTSDEEWNGFEQALLAHIQSLGIRIARNYVCLDDPEGKGRHRKDSVFLFPNTGVFYHAAQSDGIALSESWVLSDDLLELAAGWRAGCRIAAVRSPALEGGELTVEPQLACRDLAAALAEVLALDEYVRR